MSSDVTWITACCKYGLMLKRNFSTHAFSDYAFRRDIHSLCPTPVLIRDMGDVRCNMNDVIRAQRL